MPSELHEKQNQLACRWLKKNGFKLVGTNVMSTSSRERFDVIGFRQTCSVVVESKVSRSDFLADSKKPERNSGGVGTYRFYITPHNLITIEELPCNWGLLYTDGKSITEVHRPLGNYWAAYPSKDDNWANFQHQSDLDAERGILFTLASKLNNKQSIVN